MMGLPPAAGWIPVSVDPVYPGWYECRYYDGDYPQRYWFDGELWRHEPGGELAWFGNDGDEDGNESWRGLSMPAVALLRRSHLNLLN